MTLAQQLDFLDSLQGSGIRPGLERMQALLTAAGHPETSAPAVLIAGTNGKGSTAATLAAIAHESGIRVALYTSPHLIDIGERWRLGVEPVSETELSASIERLRELIDRTSIRPTYFEALTLLAFFIFEAWKCELQILEVGMGGRLDATNVVDPILSLITPVGFDHMEFLGTTLSQIAAEKAGIIHGETIVLTSNREEPVLSVLRDVALRHGRPFETIRDFAHCEGLHVNHESSTFQLTSPVATYSLSSPLAGLHQIDNVALAVRAAEHLAERFPITSETIVRGVAKTLWRGRLEHFRIGSTSFWIDGGHNAHAAERVASYVGSHLRKPRALLFAMMKDKDVEKTAATLFPLFDRVVTTQVDFDRGLSPQELVRIAAGLGLHAEPAQSLDGALENLASRGEDTLVAGSLYLAGAAIERLDRMKERATTPATQRSDSSQAPPMK